MHNSSPDASVMEGKHMMSKSVKAPSVMEGKHMMNTKSSRSSSMGDAGAAKTKKGYTVNKYKK